jgi:hypothetical protein
VRRRRRSPCEHAHSGLSVFGRGSRRNLCTASQHRSISTVIMVACVMLRVITPLEFGNYCMENHRHHLKTRKYRFRINTSRARRWRLASAADFKHVDESRHTCTPVCTITQATITHTVRACEEYMHAISQKSEIPLRSHHPRCAKNSSEMDALQSETCLNLEQIDELSQHFNALSLMQ